VEIPKIKHNNKSKKKLLLICSYLTNHSNDVKSNVAIIKIINRTPKNLTVITKIHVIIVNHKIKSIKFYT
jgi:hypothetical protein